MQTILLHHPKPGCDKILSRAGLWSYNLLNWMETLLMMFQEKFSLKGEERRAGRTEQTRHIGEASGLEKFSPPSWDTLHLFVVKMTGQTGEGNLGKNSTEP